MMAAADWATWLVEVLQSTKPVDIEIDGIAMQAYVLKVSAPPRETYSADGMCREYVPSDDIAVELRLTFEGLTTND